MPADDILHLERRLRRLLGLGPAVVAAATIGCDAPLASAPPISGPGDVVTEASDRQAVQQTIGVHGLGEELADPPNKVPEVEAFATAVGPGPIPVTHMEIEIAGEEWVPKHVQRVTVRGAPPDTLVSLVGGAAGSYTCFAGDWCFAMDNPGILGQAYSDLDGVVEFRFLTPPWLRFTSHDQLGVQAVVHTPRARISHAEFRPLVAPYTGEIEIGVFHPERPIDTIQHLERNRACVPWTRQGCKAVEDFDEWEAREIAAYALARPLGPEIAVGVCEEDDAHQVDCCYIVETFEVQPGQTDAPEDLCTQEAEWTDWYGGRPFAVAADDAHAPRMAPTVPSADWSTPLALVPPTDVDARDAVAAAWRRAAQSEHASVASFSRFNLELLSLGAPAELLHASTQAIAEEIRHAELAFAVTSQLTGQGEGPGPLPVDGALARSSNPHDVLVAAVVEGCINETVSAMQLQRVIPSIVDPLLAARVQEVLDDELRHAELSWAFVRWMLQQHPHLVPAAEEAFVSFRLGPAPAEGPHDATLAAYGAPPAALAHTTAAEVLERVVLPCAEAMLRQLSPGSEVAEA